MPLLCNFAFEYALRKVQVKEERVVVELDFSHIQGRTGRGYREWGAEDIWAERREQQAGEMCIMIFVICTRHQILFG